MAKSGAIGDERRATMLRELEVPTYASGDPVSKDVAAILMCRTILGELDLDERKIVLELLENDLVLEEDRSSEKTWNDDDRGSET